MVIDLSNGPAEHMFYPVRYTNAPPDISDDACRTTNLWLRLILPGTFMMGSPTMELGCQTTEDLHQVTLTKPFYIGVFQMTQRQYEGAAKPASANLEGILTPFAADPLGLGFYLLNDSWKSGDAKPVTYPLKRSFPVEIHGQ